MKPQLLGRVEASFSSALALWLALASVGLGVGDRFFGAGISTHRLGVFFGMSAAAALDLWLLARASWAIIEVVAPTEAQKQGSQKWLFARIRAFVWASIKLACVGFLILLLFRTQGPDWGPAILGLITLFAVPTIGGILWALKEQGSAKRAR